jgi:hypothetical protein
MTDDDRRTDGENDRDETETDPSFLERVRRLAETLDGRVIERIDHDGRPTSRRYHNGLLTVVLDDGGERSD